MEEIFLNDLKLIYESVGISHLIIDSSDIPTFDISRFFDEATHFIKRGLKNGNVLIHCFAGISRSSAITIAYMMEADNNDWKHCLKMLKKNRPLCNPNPGFRKGLEEYQKKLENEN